MSDPKPNLIEKAIINAAVSQLKAIDFRAIITEHVGGLLQDTDHNGKPQIEDAMIEFEQAFIHFENGIKLVEFAVAVKEPPKA